MFTFTNDCLIGISEIDEEHRQLFELIAKTDEALKNNDDSVTDALLLVNELKHYAALHFTHEEGYMKKINDPELKRQQKEHGAFIEKVNSYNFSNITKDNASDIILELLEYLAKWLMGHILGSDILIGHFTQKSGLVVPKFDDSFKTGIPLIDDEHKTLFDIIGEVHATLNAEHVHDKFDSIISILNKLKEYTQIHFSDEESYMQSISYEGLEKQVILHQKFIDKLNELDLDDVDNNQEKYLYSFLEFLQNWLVNHILKIDKLIPRE